MQITIDIDEHKHDLVNQQDLMQAKTLLAKLYGEIYIEACYDPSNEDTKTYAEGLLPTIQELNKILHFKK